MEITSLSNPSKAACFIGSIALGAVTAVALVALFRGSLFQLHIDKIISLSTALITGLASAALMSIFILAMRANREPAPPSTTSTTTRWTYGP